MPNLSSGLLLPGEYLVRVGVLGQIGRFRAATGELIARGRRVVCRTRRGLEVGQVVGEPPHGSERTNGLPDPEPGLILEQRHDGLLLRRLTVEDELLLSRLEQNRAAAFAACTETLQQRRIPATLVDVEHLFDGRSLYFYFWGEVTPEIDALTQELAEAYEARVQFRKFADAVERGCGPACGTDEATGCGTGCSSCSLVNACGPK